MSLINKILNIYLFHRALFLLFAVFSLINPSHADDDPKSISYEVIVDAGSTGSRLHIYSIEPGDQFPKITEIFYNPIEPGLGTLANAPGQIPVYLGRLFNPAQRFCYTKQLPCSEMPIYFLATAGMRLIPDQTQKNMFNSISMWLQDNTIFGDVKELSTMSGKKEAAFGWLTAYEADLINNKPTGAFFELGGASMQYAFTVPKASDSNFTFDLPDRKVYLKLGSWLGFGGNEAVRRVTDYWSRSQKVCYPQGLKTPNSPFKYKECFDLFKHYLDVNENYEKQQQLVQANVELKRPIILVAKFRSLFEFFGTLDPDKIHAQLKSTCAQTWQSMRKGHPLVDPEELQNFCVEGTYVMSLFDAFGLPKHYKNYSIPQSSWTQGMVLYHWLLSKSEQKV